MVAAAAAVPVTPALKTNNKEIKRKKKKLKRKTETLKIKRSFSSGAIQLGEAPFGV